MTEQYIKEIRTCLQSNCNHAALALALMLPDICGMAEWSNKNVTERYVDWFDEFVYPKKQNDPLSPQLSGEMVYNLRNRFLHQGEPTIDREKIRESCNQLDEFDLIFGKGDVLFSSSTVLMKDTYIRKLKINVRYLCNAICDGVEVYERQRQNKTKTPLPQKETPPVKTASEPKKKTSASQKATLALIDEHRLRCFFGQTFKEPKYKDKKEAIIKAVLAAKTKVELNTYLTRLFPGQDVKEILKRLKPLTGSLPGQ